MNCLRAWKSVDHQIHTSLYHSLFLTVMYYDWLLHVSSSLASPQWWTWKPKPNKSLNKTMTCSHFYFTLNFTVPDKIPYFFSPNLFFPFSSSKKKKKPILSTAQAKNYNLASLSYAYSISESCWVLDFKLILSIISTMTNVSL